MKTIKIDSICKNCYHRHPTNPHRCFKNVKVIRVGINTNVSGRHGLSKDGLSCKYFVKKN